MSWWLDIADLDKDQGKVIELPPEGDYVIVGPPGSGKTNLLLLRAQYLIMSGKPNVVVLMFNDPLHEFVVRGGANYQVPSAKIKKIMSWEITLLREHGVPFDDVMEDDDQDLVEKRRALASRVLELLNQQPQLEHSIQCLLVDEVQDCVEEEIEVFSRCAENVCYAGDEKQRIFNRENMVKVLKEDPDLDVVPLTTHYRIGHRICEAVDVVGKIAGFDPILDSCNYKGPTSSVRFSPCPDDDTQAQQIIENLTSQLKAYPDELLGVAAPRNADRDFLRARLEASALAANVLPHRKSGSADPNQRIYVAGLMEIKGLEFRTVHLALMQHLYRLGETQKRIAYTAMTRAMTSLSVYYTGRIPPYLEAAKAALEPPKAAPNVADLFPKKKAKK
jgi:superfamily I DNA/RNA helicase